MSNPAIATLARNYAKRGDPYLKARAEAQIRTDEPAEYYEGIIDALAMVAEVFAVMAEDYPDSLEPLAGAHRLILFTLGGRAAELHGEAMSCTVEAE